MKSLISESILALPANQNSRGAVEGKFFWGLLNMVAVVVCDKADEEEVVEAGVSTTLACSSSRLLISKA